MAVLADVLAQFGPVPCYIEWVAPETPRRARISSAWVARSSPTFTSQPTRPDGASNHCQRRAAASPQVRSRFAGYRLRHHRYPVQPGERIADLPIGQIRLEDVQAQTRKVLTYAVRVTVDGLVIPRLEVILTGLNYVVFGRDVLNCLYVLLKGPEGV